MMADFILSIMMLNDIVNCKYNMMYLPMISNIYTAHDKVEKYGLKFSNCVWVVLGRMFARS